LIISILAHAEVNSFQERFHEIESFDLFLGQFDCKNWGFCLSSTVCSIYQERGMGGPKPFFSV
jgi:hypothetical protein